MDEATGRRGDKILGHEGQLMCGEHEEIFPPPPPNNCINFELGILCINFSP